VNADTEPQAVPGQPRLTNQRSQTCSVKVARAAVRQPFPHLDSPPARRPTQRTSFRPPLVQTFADMPMSARSSGLCR
jgi:hypothetical protein